MKKLFVLISVLLVMAACAAPAPEKATVNTNTAEKPSTAAITEADAIAKEKAIWDTLTKKDYDAFAAMLDSGQLEVTTEGAVHDKAASITMVKDFEPSEVTFSNWKFLSVDEDAFIVVYDASLKGKYKGKDFPPTTVHASSAWANRDGKWLAIYHQECEAMTMPPPPPPAAKPDTSPAATPAQATATADPVANEKMIWDLLKAKQYDAFAAVVATDAIEVTPNGVFDKTGIINSVKGADFSKSTLSDFKTLNIDSDAALVNYLVTTPGAKPAEERHTTIWAMRDGKWLAVFHHGTPFKHAMGSSSPMTHPMGSSSPMTHPMGSPSPK
ncbi:MAG: DUF4440 domain-containing protein [Pyrinomonadaceae bacterium]